MVTKEQIDEIIENTDIVELVSQYVSLQKSGSGYKGLCPFHDDKTPSFSVSPSKKIAKCMSCGEGGNPIKFLMKIKNIPFYEALSELAMKCGIDIDVRVAKSQNLSFNKFYEITSFSNKFFQRNLLSTKSGQEALNYLYNRGINDEIIKKFGIGLAPANYNNLYEILKQASYLELDMLDLGLIHSSKDKYYDMFNKRIIFPIIDEQSNVLGFSGRAYDNVLEPKYLNSIESTIFKKGMILYNLNNALPSIRKKKRVILYEGFMDVIASDKASLGEAVCSMGTALTINQANLLKKYTDNVIICYDGDKAGVSASLKAISILKSANLNVSLVMLNNNMDPDEFVFKFGEEEYFNYFNENIIDEFEYFYKVVTISLPTKDFNKIDSIKTSIFNMLYQTNNNSLVEVYLNRLSLDISISVDSLLADYKIYCNKSNQSKNVENNQSPIFEEKKQVIIPNIKLNKYQEASLRLLVYAKGSKDIALDIDTKLSDEAFEKTYHTLWIELQNYYELYEEFDEKKFQNLLNKNKTTFDIYINQMNLLKSKIKTDYCDDDLLECINVLKEQEKKIQLKQHLKPDTNSIDELANIAQYKFDLKKSMDKDKLKQKKSKESRI